MHALVTGANGFIGRWLVRRLVEQGSSVRAMVRRGSDASPLAGLALDIVEGDVSDPSSLPAALRDVDIVYHLAGVLAARDPEDFQRVNVVGTENLIAAVRVHRPTLHRFVHVSSIAAGGPASLHQARSEGDEARPCNAYGRSKLGGEEAVRGMARELPTTIVRPPIVYGPEGRSIAALFRSVQRRLVVEIAGPPRPASFLHVRDLTRGLVRVAHRPEAVGELYHLAHPRQASVADFQRAIAGALGLRTVTLRPPGSSLHLVAEGIEVWKGLTGRSFPFGRDRVAEALAPSWAVEVDRVRRQLGFEATIDWDEGIPETLTDFRRRGWLR